MERGRVQMSVAALLGVVACTAVNIWLFRVGPLWGIVGLNVTKHVVIAALCQWVGVDKGESSQVPAVAAPRPKSAERPVTSTA